MAHLFPRSLLRQSVTAAMFLGASLTTFASAAEGSSTTESFKRIASFAVADNLPAGFDKQKTTYLRGLISKKQRLRKLLR
ncbi:hypothetical protein ACHELX_000740 [Vibrio vulnificus]